jgi:hypothetical protein
LFRDLVQQAAAHFQQAPVGDENHGHGAINIRKSLVSLHQFAC